MGNGKYSVMENVLLLYLPAVIFPILAFSDIKLLWMACDTQLFVVTN